MGEANEKSPSPEQYLLVALIDVYRGLAVNLPVKLDRETQNKILRDVLSSAIPFSSKEESMQTISDELFQCSRNCCTLADQIQIIKTQSPDVINAKMVAAAYLLKLLNEQGSRPCN